MLHARDSITTSLLQESHKYRKDIQESPEHNGSEGHTLFHAGLKLIRSQTLGCYREGRRHLIFFFLLQEKQKVGKEPMYQGPQEIIQVPVRATGAWGSETMREMQFF